MPSNRFPLVFVASISMVAVACSSDRTPPPIDDACRRGIERCEDPRCPGPNPTNLDDGTICFGGVGTHCCGDVGLALYCSEDAEWVCPDGSVRLSQCTTFCNPGDAGAADAALVTDAAAAD